MPPTTKTRATVKRSVSIRRTASRPSIARSRTEIKRAPTSESSNDDLIALVEALQRGERDALEQLYDLTVGKVAAMARRVLRSKSDVDEIVCDTYVQVWQTAKSFDATRGRVMAWLAMICRSRALDRLRQHKLRREALGMFEAEEDAAAEAPDDLLELFESGTAVHRALSKLSAERRRMIELAFFKGLSHQEIAAQLDQPLGTVKSHLRRALLSMREALAMQGGTHAV